MFWHTHIFSLLWVSWDRILSKVKDHMFTKTLIHSEYSQSKARRRYKLYSEEAFGIRSLNNSINPRNSELLLALFLIMSTCNRKPHDSWRPYCGMKTWFVIVRSVYFLWSSPLRWSFLWCNVPIASLRTETCLYALSNHLRLQHSWWLDLCIPYTLGAVNNEQACRSYLRNE